MRPSKKRHRLSAETTKGEQTLTTGLISGASVCDHVPGPAVISSFAVTLSLQLPRAAVIAQQKNLFYISAPL